MRIKAAFLLLAALATFGIVFCAKRLCLMIKLVHLFDTAVPHTIFIHWVKLCETFVCVFQNAHFYLFTKKYLN